MPHRRPRIPNAFTQQYTPPPTEPTWLERLGGIRGLGATGVRGLSGLLSGIVNTGITAGTGGLGLPAGMAAGAGIAGAGELGAELIEGSEPSLGRISTEAALGAVPLSKIFKAGRVGESLLRGGLYAGVGTGARELARGEELDPGAIAGSAALGGGVGGGLAKLLAPTAKMGPPPLTVLRGPEAIQDVLARNAPVSLTRRQTLQNILRGERPPVRTGPREPYIYQTPAEASPRVAKVIRAEEKANLAIAKAQEEQAAAERIAQQRVGLEPQEPSISESISAKIPGGRQRMTTRFRPTEGTSEPALEDLVAPPRPQEPIGRTQLVEAPGPLTASIGERLQAALQTARGEAPTTAEESQVNLLKRVLSGIQEHPVAPVSEAEAAITEAPPALAQLFKTRIEAAGPHYDEVQRLFKAGEVPKEAARIAGRALQREARAAGLPTQARAPQIAPEIPAIAEEIAPQKAIPAPDVPAALTPEAKANLLEQLGGPEGLKGEKGAVSPQLLARLGLGAAGALAGGAIDPFGNPLLSAAVGGAAGFAAPSIPNILRQAGAAPETLTNLPERTSTPEKLHETARSIFRTLPQIQRSNLLLGSSLPANIWFGPYGSAMMAGIEKTLSGDPRGAALVRELNPVNFYKEWRASVEEAKDLILRGELGRAESEPLSALPEGARTFVQAPGTLMTAGDVAVRKILERVGFSPEEARAITLTSEPFTKTGESAAHTRGWLTSILFPFKRTPINIAEQGALRTPGLGSLMQFGSRGTRTPDPLRVQAIQQLLGAGAGLGAGTISANLSPENRKLYRPYVTNLAGQYSLPAAIGYGVGTAFGEGKPVLRSLGTETINALPMPSTQPLTDWKNFLLGTATTPPLSKQNLPRGAGPRIISELKERGSLKAPARKTSPSAPFVTPRRRRTR